MNVIQYWNLDYVGAFTGNMDLTFCYDDTILDGEDEMRLGIFQFSTGLGVWQQLKTEFHDPINNLLYIRSGSFGPFILGYISEPVPVSLLAKLNDALPSGGDVYGFEVTPDSSRVVYLGDQDTDEVRELYSVPVGGGTPLSVI